jgi:predicted transcriptional regulator
MDSEFLTVRLSNDDARMVQRLREATGLSKSAIVKRALRLLADHRDATDEKSLYQLGAAYFGRYGDARRQSVDIKRIAKLRIHAKNTRR